jgi:sulfur-carrier protein
MPLVKLFGKLRSLAAVRSLEVDGAILRDVITELGNQNQALKNAILVINEAGQTVLQPHVRISINGRDSELDQGLDTPVQPTDQIAIFPPIAGG